MPESSLSTHETSLIVRLRENDSQAWNELVELYAPLIFHWCVSMRLQACDAADVMQDVFTSASKTIHRFKTGHGGSLQGWLWTITHNKVRDFWKKQKRLADAQGGTEANWAFAQIVDEINDEPTDEVESSQLLHRALGQIKNDFQNVTWQAFWRATIEGEDNRTIASDLGLSTNGVRQAKSRVLRRLREQLGEF
ncbi:MAG: RNA polymerase sigma factor [Mariniblastus sp.]